MQSAGNRHGSWVLLLLCLSETKCNTDVQAFMLFSGKCLRVFDGYEAAGDWKRILKDGKLCWFLSNSSWVSWEEKTSQIQKRGLVCKLPAAAKEARRGRTAGYKAAFLWFPLKKFVHQSSHEYFDFNKNSCGCRNLRDANSFYLCFFGNINIVLLFHFKCLVSIK